MMMLFRKKCELFTCCQCGLAYDARIVQEPYRHLCPEHRKEPMERDQKKAEVMRWAEREWEKLYDQAREENFAFSPPRLSGGNPYQHMPHGALQAQMGGGNLFNHLMGQMGQLW